jgi:4-diphosphocytidyl-2-C-methyl-D-erythritol kinase
MPSMRLSAFAKVNLSLRVLARETSGYHQIETLFCRIDLADDITVHTRDDSVRSIACRGADLGPAEKNLAWRAAAAYSARHGWPKGFAIEIDKQIPVGGGLGGGSADAGAVLRALNAMNPEPLAPNDLLEVAASLGADVPFLASDVPLALAWGRGERMLALPALPERDIALVLPPFGVATGEAYGWLAKSRAPASETTRETTAAARAHATERASHFHGPGPVLHPFSAVTSWEGVARISSNDFEPVVFAERPELGAIHEKLAALPAVALARMSGSGSTLFALFDEPAELRVVSQATGCRVIAARTLSSVVPHLRLD